MSVTEDEFQALEETLREIGGRLETEPWKDDHDGAMRCGNLEEKIAATLPPLDKLAAALKEMNTALVGGDTLNISELYVLNNLCTLFSETQDYILGLLRNIEQDGFQVDGASDLRARLHDIHGVLGPIGKILEEAVFRLPVLPAEQPSSDLPNAPAGPTAQPVPIELPLPGTWTRVKGGVGPVRLPDPPFLTEEQSVPFDLPRLGTWVRVKTRPGPMRLPDPIDD